MQGATLMILSIITAFKTLRLYFQAKKVKNTPFHPLPLIWVLAVYPLLIVPLRNLRVAHHQIIERAFHDSYSSLGEIKVCKLGSRQIKLTRP